MTALTCSRMFRGNLRSNTCRIVVLTSLVWLIVDVVLLLRYADYFADPTAKRPGEYDVAVGVLCVCVCACFPEHYYNITVCLV